jgi:hypothetical protein
MTTGNDRISVLELREHWDAVANLKDGDAIMSLHSHHLPVWEDVCEQLPWDTYRINGGYFSGKNHGFYGVYRLFALDVAGDVRRPTTFNRLCGQDPTGTLYVGHSNSLHSRLNQLRRSFNEYRPEGSHAVPRALKALPGLAIPASNIAVAVMFTNRLPRMIERDLLRVYISTYGDAPPLNYQL